MSEEKVCEAIVNMVPCVLRSGHGGPHRFRGLGPAAPTESPKMKTGTAGQHRAIMEALLLPAHAPYEPKVVALYNQNVQRAYEYGIDSLCSRISELEGLVREFSEHCLEECTAPSDWLRGLCKRADTLLGGK